jgi:hypothetical protein
MNVITPLIIGELRNLFFIDLSFVSQSYKDITRRQQSVSQKVGSQ